MEYILETTQEVLHPSNIVTIGSLGAYSDDEQLAQKFIFLYNRCLQETLQHAGGEQDEVGEYRTLRLAPVPQD